MSDFCRQCNLELFNLEWSDYPTDLEPLPEGIGYCVLCEGCGPIVIDHTGRCIDPLCPKHGTLNTKMVETIPTKDPHVI